MSYKKEGKLSKEVGIVNITLDTSFTEIWKQSGTVIREYISNIEYTYYMREMTVVKKPESRVFNNVENV